MKQYSVSYDNSRLCLREHVLAVQGQATDIAIQAEEILKLKKMLNELLAGHTGQPLSVIGMSLGE